MWEPRDDAGLQAVLQHRAVGVLQPDAPAVGHPVHGGTISSPSRPAQVVALSETWKNSAIQSLNPQSTNHR
ncbi:hypothetical protein Ae717Ps2_6064c [Pseudonocardia sp. Ae717_Ps2]|nr:hypothetical protein Ae717Ps2_6064c [Pseudonocardia sp. Ae717_Ps2]